MKKHLLKGAVLSLSLSLFFGFTSCKKDGVYNPKKKISKIFKQSGGSKILAETWTWDKNRVSKIEYTNGSYQKFEYEKKQMSKILSSSGDYAKLVYDGSKINKIESYVNNTLSSSYKFEHKGNKISKVTVERYYTIGTNNAKLATNETNILRFILPEEISEDIAAFNLEKKNRKATGTYTVTYKITWKGDNIEEMVLESLADDKIYTETYKFTYDKKKNPTCGLLTYSGIDPVGHSKNNVTKTAATNSNNIFWDYEFSYTYDRNYPKEVTRVYRSGSRTTTDVTFYEYED
jgi:hypothetical protein